MDAEMAVIGLAVKKPGVFEELKNMGLKASHFELDGAGVVWEIMEELSSAGIAINLGAVMIKTSKYGPFVLTCFSECPADAPEHWAREVMDGAWTRRVSRVFSDIAIRMVKRQPFESVEQLRTLAINACNEAAVATSSPYASACASDIVSRFVDEMEAPEQRSIRTGFKCIDVGYGGIFAPDLWVIAARPNIGKTTFAVNLALNAALNKHAVAFFTVEMRDTQIMAKAISSHSKVPLSKVRRRSLDEHDFDRLTNSLKEISQVPLSINDKARKIEWIIDEIRRLHRLKRCDISVIDYLQLITTEKRHDSRQKELSEITMALKGVALDLNIPIVACAQLNRDADRGPTVRNAGPKRASLSMIKDSGSIEQDADVVVFIERDDETEQYRLNFAKARLDKRAIHRIDANLVVNTFSDANYNVEPMK